jgi:hypothetical protein
MYLFGSKLIKKYFSDFREPNDTDWVTNDKSKLKPSKIGKEEYYYIPFSPNREMTADEIYTVKVSHAIYDIHWKKTMSDIRFLQIKGCKILPDLLKDLRLHWESVHGLQKRVDFEVEPGNFFEDRVRRKVNHDELHQMINQTPTYLKMIQNGVNPNPTKYHKLTEDEKREVLFEESFVIAIERFSKANDRMAYHIAQQSLVTRLHPVWLADEVIKNWNKWYWNPQNSKFYNKYKEIKNG